MRSFTDRRSVTSGNIWEALHGIVPLVTVQAGPDNDPLWSTIEPVYLATGDPEEADDEFDDFDENDFDDDFDDDFEETIEDDEFDTVEPFELDE